LLTAITAAGCSLTALIAAFVAAAAAGGAAAGAATASGAPSGQEQGQGQEQVEGQQGQEVTMLATAAALAIFGLAAEEGLRLCPRPGPGSLRVALLDLLHLMDEDTVVAGVRLERL
ncbi:hypothetical protein Agub_g6533, partial [Astrephomene gubernaculifera]